MEISVTFSHATNLVAQLVKKFPTFYRTQTFIIVYTATNQ